MYMTIWIANETIPWVTALGQSTGMNEAGGHLAALDQGGCPITYIFTQIFARSNLTGMAVIAVIYAICLVFAVRLSRQRAKELETE